MTAAFEEIKMPESVVWKVTGQWSSDLTHATGSNLYKLEPGYTYQIQVVNLSSTAVTMYRTVGSDKNTRQGITSRLLEPGEMVMVPSLPVPDGSDIRLYPAPSSTGWGKVGELVEAKLFAFPIVKE